ncbi:MAG: hypothetical protein NTV01_02685 [Bacteroidia bacterium]|nr:hypothetical protein [Bacteroidia bacterium]
MGGKSYRIITLIGLILLLAFCKKEEAGHNPPQIVSSFSPWKGLTTTVFSFDFRGSIIDKPDQNKLFFRWDWDNDGFWDSPFSNNIQFEHRYLVAGKKLTKVIAMDLNGLSDTAQFEINVEQGYSKPKPHLVVTPATGTPYTEFILDASGTKDDEDSIETLRFRWDLDGNRQFDTGFTSSSIYHYQFPTIGIYLPMVEVIDTMGLTDNVSGLVVITLLDTSIVANFEWTPKSPVSEDTIFFDASSSHDSLYPDRAMKYRWDWQNDGIFDTQFSDSSQAQYSFLSDRLHSVRLEVKNYRGLINQVVKEVLIGHRNKPPVASFVASSIGGNTRTQIRFDLWGCRDPENSPSELLSRWDWNGDGVWDTDFSYTMEVFHVFSEPGIYPVKVNIMDEGGLTDTARKTISIGTGTNQTDILLDKRGASGYEYYGTVRIGDQWWFAKNLEFQHTNSQGSGYYQMDFGRLYPANNLSFVCPDGWKVPTKEDWEKLFSQYEASTLYEDLFPGGKSGFNIVLAGMVNNEVVPKTITGKDVYGYYWSQTKLNGLEGSSHWIITFDNKQQKVLPGYNSSLGSYSVRCIKDAQ